MTLSPGTQFGPYAIVTQLGSGGMGVVYEATDPRLKRTVAIKLLPPDLTKDDTAKQRFLQEAQAASALDHPSISNVQALNETPDGQLYLGLAHYEKGARRIGEFAIAFTPHIHRPMLDILFHQKIAASFHFTPMRPRTTVTGHPSAGTW